MALLSCFFHIDHLILVGMSTRKLTDMLCSRCVDMLPRNSFTECKWTLSRL